MARSHPLSGGIDFYVWHLAGAIVASNEQGVLIRAYFGGDGAALAAFAGGNGWYMGYGNEGVCQGASQEYEYQYFYDYREILGNKY